MITTIILFTVGVIVILMLSGRSNKMNNIETENKILDMVVIEKTNKEIAKELCISVKSVEKKIKNLFYRFKVKSRIGLVREYLKEKFSC